MARFIISYKLTRRAFELHICKFLQKTTQINIFYLISKYLNLFVNNEIQKFLSVSVLYRY